MSGAEARVLVVEDEAIVAMDISARLRLLGYEVIGPASTGADAVELAESARPDLVLMDIMLRGGMDGVEAALRIREGCGAPVVYLTAYADDSTLRRAKAAEPLGYLLKPFEERELRTAIETALYKHRAEMRLRESERWLATTLRSIGDAVIAADERGRVKLINPAAEILTGWPQDEALGRELAEVFQLTDEATGLRVEPTTDAARTDVLLASRDGRSTPVEASASVITDEQGGLRGSVLIFKDISERRRLSMLLLRSEKLAAVGQLAAGMAHELNNPLTPALLYTRRLLRQGGLDAEARGHLEVVVREVERAQGVIKDLLAFARQYQANWSETEVNELLRRALSRAEGEAPSPKVSVRFHPGEDVRVVADEYRLTQVFLNIIRNARQAIEEGGRAGTVTVTSELINDGGGGRVRVTVTDDGPGVARENLAKIFDPFFTTRQVGAGAGLGLSLSNGIIEEHGGTISVESEPSAGATFIVEIPTRPPRR
ncbi:MAG TPA: ATP-binding protein [Pyrinomonadaceae bacterium]|nr:ATP-binding protein [Pyrinomonadaceae bacterium]